MNLQIETERLTLAPLQMSDIGLGIELFTDPKVLEYLWEVQTEQEIRQDMPVSIRRAAAGAIGVWTILDLNTGEKYGTCCLLPLPIDEDDTNWDLVAESQPVDYEVEIGYILKPSAWGKGIASEAAAALLDFGFEHLQIGEIVGIIDERNIRSRNVLLKIGLEAIGQRKAYNEICPGYRITRAQWSQQFSD